MLVRPLGVEVGLGLHQGSTLSPLGLLFANEVGRLTDEIRKEASLQIILCCVLVVRAKKLEEDLEVWTVEEKALTGKDRNENIKIPNTETDYFCLVGTSEESVKMLQPTPSSSTLIGSVIQTCDTKAD